ncbi:MAG TPA: hypothetical protein PKA05_04895 [Roseiflexaceae bacterium]|nr:hypothetical protein [Roseiflexaceae bacterium]HMP39699.1 hypothetical protein [Roseiflexaceae bacterium]
MLQQLINRIQQQQEQQQQKHGPRTLEQLEAYVGLPMLPFRLFWDHLAALRPWWPWLLPLLAWITWSNYRRERARLIANRNKSA